MVEVDQNNQKSQHHTTAVSPQSPVSILQNSPFYSPVRQQTRLTPSSPHSSTVSTPFMEQVIGNVCSDDQDEEIINDAAQEMTNDSDEGIESEDAEIDGEAFKQLIRLVD